MQSATLAELVMNYMVPLYDGETGEVEADIGGGLGHEATALYFIEPRGAKSRRRKQQRARSPLARITAY